MIRTTFKIYGGAYRQTAYTRQTGKTDGEGTLFEHAKVRGKREHLSGKETAAHMSGREVAKLRLADVCRVADSVYVVKALDLQKLINLQ